MVNEFLRIIIAFSQSHMPFDAFETYLKLGNALQVQSSETDGYNFQVLLMAGFLSHLLITISFPLLPLPGHLTGLPTW